MALSNLDNPDLSNHQIHLGQSFFMQYKVGNFDKRQLYKALVLIKRLQTDLMDGIPPMDKLLHRLIII